MERSTRRLGIRWTIGDVSDAGFEALRWSIEGAHRVFPDAERVVYVNTLATAEARRRCGPVTGLVAWRSATHEVPRWLAAHLDDGFAEGVAWKLAPVRAFPDRHELSLDNDVILWSLPAAIASWLRDEGSCLLAEDVRACFGRFAPQCGNEPRNLGIRGLPPGFDLEQAMQRVLAQWPGKLASELDEQGLQVAAIGSGAPTHVVPLRDVTICSPFPPHLPRLGACGAHFCGVNTKKLGWTVDGRSAERVLHDHWAALRGAVAARATRAHPACSPY
ncbi:hypothetical protein [Pendulispora albinea]|uniref:Uncharacterized protein n=1 Tax=Pendulispora albinea TaxID=2741071 RepID=A0ABZ2M6Z3_9BACT